MPTSWSRIAPDDDVRRAGLLGEVHQQGQNAAGFNGFNGLFGVGDVAEGGNGTREHACEAAEVASGCSDTDVGAHDQVEVAGVDGGG
nr:hypothetical protein [Streptomyces sp. ISL-44]